MIDLYSFTLALALLLALIAVASALWSKYRLRSRRGLRAARLMAVLAVACDLASVLVHLAFGHRPGTSAALPLTAFLAEHPAFTWVFVLAILAWLGSRSVAPKKTT